MDYGLVLSTLQIIFEKIHSYPSSHWQNTPLRGGLRESSSRRKLRMRGKRVIRSMVSGGVPTCRRAPPLWPDTYHGPYKTCPPRVCRPHRRSGTCPVHHTPAPTTPTSSLTSSPTTPPTTEVQQGVPKNLNFVSGQLYNLYYVPKAFLPLTQKQVQSSIINCLEKYERFFLTYPSMLGTDPDLSPNVCKTLLTCASSN